MGDFGVIPRPAQACVHLLAEAVDESLDQVEAHVDDVRDIVMIERCEAFWSAAWWKWRQGRDSNVYDGRCSKGGGSEDEKNGEE